MSAPTEDTARQPLGWSPRPDADAVLSAPVRDLLEVARSLHSSLDLAETMETVVRRVAHACGFQIAALNIRYGDVYETVAVEGGDEVREALMGKPVAVELWADLLDQSRRWGEIRFIHHDDRIGFETEVPSWRPPLEATEDPDAWHPDDMLFVPLTNAAGEQIGTLSVDVPFDGRIPTESQCEMLAVLAHHAALAIEHAMVYDDLSLTSDQLAWAATHDRLTGVFDRSVFDHQVPERAARRGTGMAILAIDLDEFKKINDTAGHQVGDLVLAAVAGRMQQSIRSNDLLARVGGDEFVVVATADSPGPTAEHLAERIMSAISEPVEVEGTPWRLSASIGCAAASTPVDPDALLAEADAAMYRQKRARGRR